MFNIKFYNNKSANNVINKNIEEAFTISGVLKESSSCIKPTILIERSSYPNVNYCYIEDFKRYYYVNNITSVRNNLWEMSLNVDPLYTYASKIRILKGVVSRQEKNYDLSIPDDRLVTKPDRIINTIKFGSTGVSFKPDEGHNILMLTNNS